MAMLGFYPARIFTNESSSWLSIKVCCGAFLQITENKERRICLICVGTAILFLSWFPNLPVLVITLTRSILYAGDQVYIRLMRLFSLRLSVYKFQISGNHNMNNKYFKVALSIVQLCVGLLGTAVFINSLLNNGRSIESTILSLVLMILGLLNGVKGIHNVKK